MMNEDVKLRTFPLKLTQEELNAIKQAQLKDPRFKSAQEFIKYLVLSQVGYTPTNNGNVNEAVDDASQSDGALD